MSALHEILIALGGNAMLLIVLGFLARSLIQSLLAKDIKKFETDLQNRATSQLKHLRYELKSQGDISIEQLKSQLQQATIEHQVRFSSLHEKRAQVLVDLYSRIVEQSVGCQRYVYYKLGQSNRQEAFFELKEKFESLDLFFEKSQIYLPEYVCISVEKLLEALRGPVARIYVFSDGYGSGDDPDNAAQRKERSDSLLAAIKAFEAEVPAAKRVLEGEFRRMLGVEILPSRESTS